MTSASELFHNRRSRLDRNTNTLDLGLGLDSPAVVDRISHHHHNRRHPHTNRRDRADNIDNNCDSLRRPFTPARPIHRLSLPERESIRPEQGNSQSTSSNVINLENFRSISNRQSFGGNDRLPGAVLLARERLLERLRGVSSSGNRQRSRVSSGLNEDDLAFGVSNRVADPEDWDINSRTDWLLASEETRKRPPGLTQEALNSLHTETFGDQEKSDETTNLRASKECSICLESFMEGEKLLCLACGHKFHSCCLEPWVRTCGDCPNCRTGIAVSNYQPIK